MSDTDEAEELRRALRQHEEPYSIGDLTQRAIVTGTAVRRRRTMTRGLAGVLAAVVLAVAAASLLPPRTGDSADPEPAPQPSAPSALTIAWAQSLPAYQGEPTPFVLGNRVHFGSKTVDLDADDAGDAVETTNGVVLLVENDQTGAGGEFTSGYALVNPSGEVTALPATAGGDNVLASPTGDTVAYGRTVIDTQTRDVVATLPARVERLVSWTTLGITYVDTGGGYSITQPEGTPEPVVGDPGVYPSGTRFGLRSTDGCSEVVSQTPDGSSTPTAEFCGSAPLFTISPDGGVAIDKNLQVVTTSDGTRRPFDGAPRFDLPGYTTFVWTADDRVVFPVHDRDEGVGYVVTCSVHTLGCERQGGPYVVDEGQDIELAK